MQAMAFRDDDPRLLAGGNLIRLPRTVWWLATHRRSHDNPAQPATIGWP